MPVNSLFLEFFYTRERWLVFQLPKQDALLISPLSGSNTCGILPITGSDRVIETLEQVRQVKGVYCTLYVD